MTIKFECPNCHRKLSVKDELAGKKGKCPGCTKNVQIPAASAPAAANGPARKPASTPALPPLPPPPALDGPQRTQEEIDAEAIDALIDKPAEVAAATEVTFACEMCGETVTFKADQAGKRAPCPECRRIIKVPAIEQKKEKPKDWREMDRQPPPPKTGNPEDQLGATTTTGLTKKTQDEYDLIPRREKPVPLIEKIFWPAAYGLVLLSAAGLAGGVYVRIYGGEEQRLLDAGLGYVKDGKAAKQLGPEGVAAVHRAAGVYFLNKEAPDAAAKGREQLEAALAALAGGRGDVERDAGLLDVALATLDHSADQKTDPAVERGEKLNPDDAQKILTGVLRTIRDPDARREAIRLVAGRLIQRGQGERALALAGLSATAPTECAEAQALVGLEFHAGGSSDLAGRALDRALTPFAAKDAPVVPAAVQALAQLMQKPLPPNPKTGPDAEEQEGTGKVIALARSGKLDEARALVRPLPDDQLRFRRTVALAVATAATEPTDVEAAIKLLEGPLKKNPNVPAWLVLRLVRLGVTAGLPADRLREVAFLPEVDDPAARVRFAEVRGRAALVVLEKDLAGAKDSRSATLAELEKQHPGRLNALLATEILCRHNAAMNSSWGNDIQGMDERQKAFAALGVLQGRHK